jgi:GT2 family glycosyltransferase
MFYLQIRSFLVANDLPLVSVVIPHKGDQEKLMGCLGALERQTYPNSKIDILVVLNEPLTVGVLGPVAPNVTVLWQPMGHSYAARNLGIRHARGDVVALTDSDTVPSSTWIEKATSALVGETSMVAGRIDLTFETQPLTAAACYEKRYAFDQEKNCYSGHSVTANLIVSASVFRKHGLFDESAISGEDFDWTRRVTDGGEKMVFGQEVLVYHPARDSLRQLIQKARRDSIYRGNGLRPVSLFRYGFRRWSGKYRGKRYAVRTATMGRLEVLKAILIAIIIQAVQLSALLRSALFPRRSYTAGW